MRLRWPLMWKSTHEQVVLALEIEVYRKSPKWFVVGTRPHSRGMLLDLISNDEGGRHLQVIVHPNNPTLRPEFHPTVIGCVPESNCEIVQEPMRTHETEVQAISQVTRRAGDPYVSSDDLPVETFKKVEAPTRRDYVHQLGCPQRMVRRDTNDPCPWCGKGLPTFSEKR